MKRPLILLTADHDVTASGQECFVLNKNYAEAIIKAGDTPILSLDSGSTMHYVDVFERRRIKMKKPLILLTTGHDVTASGQQRFVLNKNYAEAIIKAGGIPVLALDPSSAMQYVDICDGLLITGGVDIDPKYYGEQPLNDTVVPDPARDDMEFPILKEFVNAKKPILGICRGFQILNVAFGGTLWQDLPVQKNLNHSTETNATEPVLHPVEFVQDSFMGKTFGNSVLTNTYHHQAIKDIGKGFKVVAYSDEIIPEAFEHTELPILAVQWHPERMIEACPEKNTPDMFPVFEKFISWCNK